jgi:hypothetical protein
MVYIYLKLVTISQLPPKIWPKKGPNIPPKLRKYLNSTEEIIKNLYYIVNNPQNAII